VRDPDLVNRLVDAFGSQCVVVGIDSIGAEGQWTTRQMTGDPERMQATGRATLEWIAEVSQRGAGEIVLNCMGRDGTLGGYDIEQLGAVRRRCRVPLVASGGAGSARHFVDLFRLTEVDAALAASVFHDDTVPIPTLKATLRAAGIEVRHECC
jgi:cyclase